MTSRLRVCGGVHCTAFVVVMMDNDVDSRCPSIRDSGRKNVPGVNDGVF